MFAMGRRSRGPPQWRVIATRVTEHRWTEAGEGHHPREGEDLLEAMLHWRDPAQRLRTLSHRRKSLLDDNPSSG
jgi:hypothetical protein